MAGIAMVLTVFNACQKDESGLETQDSLDPKLDAIHFSVEDNHLVFETEAEYQKVLDYLA